MTPSDDSRPLEDEEFAILALLTGLSEQTLRRMVDTPAVHAYLRGKLTVGPRSNAPDFEDDLLRTYPWLTLAFPNVCDPESRPLVTPTRVETGRDGLSAGYNGAFRAFLFVLLTEMLPAWIETINAALGAGYNGVFRAFLFVLLTPWHLARSLFHPTRTWLRYALVRHAVVVSLTVGGCALLCWLLALPSTHALRLLAVFVLAVGLMEAIRPKNGRTRRTRWIWLLGTGLAGLACWVLLPTTTGYDLSESEGVLRGVGASVLAVGLGWWAAAASKQDQPVERTSRTRWTWLLDIGLAGLACWVLLPTTTGYNFLGSEVRSRQLAGRLESAPAEDIAELLTDQEERERLTAHFPHLERRLRTAEEAWSDRHGEQIADGVRAIYRRDVTAGLSALAGHEQALRTAGSKFASDRIRLRLRRHLFRLRLEGLAWSVRPLLKGDRFQGAADRVREMTAADDLEAQKLSLERELTAFRDRYNYLADLARVAGQSDSR